MVSSNRPRGGKRPKERPSWSLPPIRDIRERPLRFTRTAQTDQSGRFSLEGLVPAEYLMCGLADQEVGREMDLDYLRSLEKDSERIDLSPGEAARQTLVAVAAPELN